MRLVDEKRTAYEKALDARTAAEEAAEIALREYSRALATSVTVFQERHGHRPSECPGPGKCDKW